MLHTNEIKNYPLCCMHSMCVTPLRPGSVNRTLTHVHKLAVHVLTVCVSLIKVIRIHFSHRTTLSITQDLKATATHLVSCCTATLSSGCRNLHSKSVLPIPGCQLVCVGECSQAHTCGHNLFLHLLIRAFEQKSSLALSQHLCSGSHTLPGKPQWHQEVYRNGVEREAGQKWFPSGNGSVVPGCSLIPVVVTDISPEKLNPSRAARDTLQGWHLCTQKSQDTQVHNWKKTQLIPLYCESHPPKMS